MSGVYVGVVGGGDIRRSREEVGRGQEEEVSGQEAERRRERGRSGGVTDFEISRRDYTPPVGVTAWAAGWWSRWEAGLLRSLANACPAFLSSIHGPGQRVVEAQVGDSSPDLGTCRSGKRGTCEALPGMAMMAGTRSTGKTSASDIKTQFG